MSGAYGDQMTSVVEALLAYRDWVWAHPSPLLVAAYFQPGTALYQQDLQSMTVLKERSWHALLPSPEVGPVTEVARAPMPLARGVPVRDPDAPNGPVVAVVRLAQPSGRVLSTTGAVVGLAPGAGDGDGDVDIALDQDARGQWLIAFIRPIGPLNNE